MNTFELKPLSRQAIPGAIEKAVRYRLLNEPGEAESICHDVLCVDPENQEALVILLLAMTDRFGRNYGVGALQAEEVLARLQDPYERAYYAGIIAERQAKGQLLRGGFAFQVSETLREAMAWYEKAEAIRPPGNDDALLRWNACARMIMRNNLSDRIEESMELPLE
jgi:hypothetical protein